MSNDKHDLNDVVTSDVTEDGVKTITKGVIVCAQVREGLRNVLKDFDPEGYATYRTIKYPAGKGSNTEETGRAATAFLFTRTGELLTPHYLSTAQK